MTSAEATAGRNALAAAPLLAISGDRTPVAVFAAGEDATAAALGGLATLLRECLAAAVRGARGGDQAACDRSVTHAARIAALLAGAG